jgi:hypothetical protein
VFAAARRYFETRYPDKNPPAPDPINAHVQFLFPVPDGPARISVKDLSITKQYSVIQIEIQKEQKDKSFQTCTIAIVTQGNLAAESGQTIPADPPTIPMKDIPDRETKCEEWKLPPLVLNSFPVSRKMRNFPLKGGKEGRWNDRLGLSIKEQWMKLADENARFDVLSLGFVCDMVSRSTLSGRQRRWR